jgi:hypothetical protein
MARDLKGAPGHPGQTCGNYWKLGEMRFDPMEYPFAGIHAAPIIQEYQSRPVPTYHFEDVFIAVGKPANPGAFHLKSYSNHFVGAGIRFLNHDRFHKHRY